MFKIIFNTKFSNARLLNSQSWSLLILKIKQSFLFRIFFLNFEKARIDLPSWDKKKNHLNSV